MTGFHRNIEINEDFSNTVQQDASEGSGSVAEEAFNDPKSVQVMIGG